MRSIHQLTRKTLLLPLLAILIQGTAVYADEPGSDEPESDPRIVLRKALSLRDCPAVKVHGVGDVKVLSLSPRGFLGVETSRLTPELRRHFNVPDDVGTMLSRVLEESAAQTAGLEVGDIITRVDGEDITSPGQLGRAIRHREGGDSIEIEYWRDGTKLFAQATLEENERCSFDIGDTLHNIDLEGLADLGNLGIEIGGEAFGTALETLHETLGSRDWEQHFENLQVIDINQIEERMERVQEQLEQLEKRLEKTYGQDMERAKRQRQRDRDRGTDDEPEGGGSDLF